MSPVYQKIISLLVLASFMAVTFFGFAIMMHGPNGWMSGDCPFSVMGASLCPQNTLATAIHLISAYHTFLNVPVGAGLTTLVISLLFAVCILLVIFIRSPLLGPPALVGIFYDSPPAASHKRKITRWLSLFENSPSLL